MSIRDGIFTTVAVALSWVALAGLLGTDAYSQAAGAEARVRPGSLPLPRVRDQGLGGAADAAAVRVVRAAAAGGLTPA